MRKPLGGGTPSRNHDTTKLWNDLPDEARSEILSVAKTRMPGHTDFSDVGNLLNAWRIVWTKARYYYEFYEDCSFEEQEETPETKWVKAGAPIERPPFGTIQMN